MSFPFTNSPLLRVQPIQPVMATAISPDAAERALIAEKKALLECENKLIEKKYKVAKLEVTKSIINAITSNAKFNTDEVMMSICKSLIFEITGYTQQK